MNRIDLRPARGNWCNQNGASPVVNPSSLYEVYVWNKSSGEFDGSSALIPTGPNNRTGKGFDQTGDPNDMGNPLSNYKNTLALSNAPVSG